MSRSFAYRTDSRYKYPHLWLMIDMQGRGWRFLSEENARIVYEWRGELRRHDPDILVTGFSQHQDQIFRQTVEVIGATHETDTQIRKDLELDEALVANRYPRPIRIPDRELYSKVGREGWLKVIEETIREWYRFERVGPKVCFVPQGS